jgi:hypothetical protein
VRGSRSSVRSIIRAHYWRDLFAAWAAATLLSGIPSTFYACLTGGDIWEATRAAGATLVPTDSTFGTFLLAAAIVHPAVSFFWAAILTLALPHRHTTLWALVAAAAIAVLDLRIIAPAFFPEVAALSFWPQMADHLMWGACLGLVLEYRWR